jgi:hypothetical protein
MTTLATLAGEPHGLLSPGGDLWTSVNYTTILLTPGKWLLIF